MIYEISGENLREELVGINLPASKSLSNRALILSALCDGDCNLSHLSDCDDTKVMLQALEVLKSGKVNDKSNPAVIDIGAAGTSMRFLTAFFATRNGAEVIMTGSERMKQRPIGILVDALRSLGAEIAYTEKEGFPPLRISGKSLKGGRLSIDGSTSSQYISALLMIAPVLSDGLELILEGQITSRPYIDMTLAMMSEFGVKADWISGNAISVKRQNYTAKSYAVESDWSAASYWYEICYLTSELGSSYVRYLLKGLKKESLQGDSRVKDYFAELGIRTEFTNEGALIRHVYDETEDERNNSESAKASDEWSMPEKVVWDLSNQPDLAQTLIATCCCTGVPFDFTGLHTLRIKETDRIKALQTELSKFGYMVEVEGDDRMTFDGKDSSKNFIAAIVDTYCDHRMAMAFAPFGINEGTFINDPEVVSKSYPTFWDDLRGAGFTITEHKDGKNPIAKKIDALTKQKERRRETAKWILNTILIATAVCILYFLIAR